MNLVKVKPSQFYGIEINNFATKVLKVCFLLSELKLSKTLIDVSVLDKNILCENALRINWNDLLPSKNCSYIISNPPFAGKKTREQLKDMKLCFSKANLNCGSLDYVTCWYEKAANYMFNTPIECCFLSTNSIVQGTQPSILWEHLENKGIYINFAYKSFKWQNQLPGKVAQVLVVIISFSYKESPIKKLYELDDNKTLICKKADHINGYLLNGKCEYVSKLKFPLDNRQIMYNGIDYIDNGIYKLSKKEKDQLLKKEPYSKEYIHPYFNGKDLLNNKTNFCLWFQNKCLFNIKKCPTILKKMEEVRKYRGNRGTKAKKCKDKPLRAVSLCYYSKNQMEKLLIFSGTFSHKYQYIPAKYVQKGSVVTHNVMLIPNASLFTFGIIESKMHMIWAKRFAGKLGDGISYSNGTVYNTFPWPKPTKTQKENIEKTAKNILDARKLYKNCTLAELYDPLTMPLELKKAHKFNDETVLNAYGFNKNITEDGVVAKLMEMYKELTNQPLEVLNESS